MKPVQYSHNSSQSDNQQLQAGEPATVTRRKSRASDKVKRTFIVAYLVMFALALGCGAILVIEPATKLPLLLQYNHALHVYADAIGSNGTSQAMWISREEQEYQCSIDYGIEYPFCGLVIKFKRGTQPSVFDDSYTYELASHIDLSIYSKILIDMDYQGPSQNLNLFFRNGPIPSNQAEYEKVPYFNAFFNTQKVHHEIDLKNFRPVSWWVDRFTPAAELLNKPFNQVFEFGIDLPAQPEAGIHTFKLKSLNLLKPIFSKVWVSYALLGVFICATIAACGQLLAGGMMSSYRAENQTLRSKISKDPLTQCLNRYGLESVVSEIFPFNSGAKAYVMVLDLDHFKNINDTFGHAMGDKVLTTAAQTFSQQLRSEDVLGRWGGEEFVVIARMDGGEHVDVLIERLMQGIRQLKFGEGVYAFGISMSVGVTAARAGEDFGSVFERADKAMYDAKNAGRNTYRIL